MIVNRFKIELRGRVLDELVDYNKFAVGTDGRVESIDDVGLGNEILRKNADSIVKLTDRIVFKCHLERSECVGQTLREVGLFNADNVMLLRKTHEGINKTQDMDVYYEIEVRVRVI